MPETKARIGFIGVGRMGGPMARNLAKAGYRVGVFDVDPAAVEACVAAGASAFASAEAAVRGADCVLTSLPDPEIYTEVARHVLVPNARDGQVFVNMGTTSATAQRRASHALHRRGATPLDAPVSGGPGGAERGDLYVFVGAEDAVFEEALPMLHVIGEPSRVTLCGGAGAGQIVKAVNQLMMGLGVAAYLEAIAFGVRSGVEPEDIERAIGREGRWRADFNAVASRVSRGEGERLGVKMHQLPMFLREAESYGFTSPMAEAVARSCEGGEALAREASGPAPSFWHELMGPATGTTDEHKPS